MKKINPSKQVKEFRRVAHEECGHKKPIGKNVEFGARNKKHTRERDRRCVKVDQESNRLRRTMRMDGRPREKAIRTSQGRRPQTPEKTRIKVNSQVLDGKRGQWRWVPPRPNPVRKEMENLADEFAEKKPQITKSGFVRIEKWTNQRTQASKQRKPKGGLRRGSQWCHCERQEQPKRGSESFQPGYADRQNARESKKRIPW